MTIFPVLKYPITERFEVDTLALLPRHILEGWWQDCVNWHYSRHSKVINVPPEPARISTYMRHHTKTQHRARHLQVLKRLIFELDE